MALINIGSTKQLFVDDYLIESMTNTRQVMNPAQKVECNPIMEAEGPDENWLSGQVTFDVKDQIFKMRYSTASYKGHRGPDGTVIIDGPDDYTPRMMRLAVSDDGIHWEKPALGLVEHEGSKKNNIIPPESSKMHNFFEDLHESDPAKRYKGLIRTGTTETPGMQFDLFYSPDGFTWTPYEGNPVIDTAPKIGRWGPTHFMGWDPIREVYAAHMENCLHRHCPLGRRLIGRAESPDMIHWSEPETIIMPDERDNPDTEFYAMPAIIYEGLYVGMLWIFQTTNTCHYPEIVFSRDGIHYPRQYRQPFIERGATGQFDSVSIYSQAPIIHNNHMYTFYHATNWRSPETLVELGDKAKTAQGLAITPLDGFVSVDGCKGVAVDVRPDHPWGEQYSQLVTRAFSFTGRQLHLNLFGALQQWGASPCDVRVEILAPNHEPLPGFTFGDADPITGGGQTQVVSWNGESDLSDLAGKAIKLRFYFNNAKLYSFQFK